MIKIQLRSRFKQNCKENRLKKMSTQKVMTKVSGNRVKHNSQYKQVAMQKTQQTLASLQKQVREMKKEVQIFKQYCLGEYQLSTNNRKQSSTQTNCHARTSTLSHSLQRPHLKHVSNVININPEGEESKKTESDEYIILEGCNDSIDNTKSGSCLSRTESQHSYYIKYYLQN